jgi:protein-disulfide isomerase
MADLECHYCARAEGTLARLKEAYGPDKLRVVWKHHPLTFHSNARAASEWAQGVWAKGGGQAFFCFVNKAYDGQARLGPDAYAKWASECGVDAKSVAAGVAAHTWSDKIDRDIALADMLGATGTPTFFINGIAVQGAQPYDRFAFIIDEELKISNLLLEQGASPERLYVVASTLNVQVEREEAENAEPEEDTKTVFKVPVGSSPARGPRNAPVTIVEFSDFQCPFCKQAEDTLTKLKSKYGDKVRFVWKDEPLSSHPRAEPSAQLAREARAQQGDKGFWAAHDRLFDAQPKLDDEDLAAIGAQLGLDRAKLKNAIKSHKYKAQIDNDADVADDFDVIGTPHFFINGRRLIGAQPIEKFSEIIDEEVTRGEGLLAKGTPPARLYDELIKDGKGARGLEKRSITLLSNAPWKGSANAPIVIQEVSDFQCPFCKRAQDTMKEILETYKGRVKIVWRNLPLSFHANASLAAQAAMEAYAQKGNEGFWKMHDLMWENQAGDGLARQALDGYAQRLGLDMKRWANALDSEAHRAAVDADAKLATDAGVNGTPAFFINGYFISGAQPPAKFRKVIARALAEQKR